MGGQASGGSGKTATFSLALLSRIDPQQQIPQALIVAPTRELVNQTEEVVGQLGQFMNVRLLKVLPQSERLERNPPQQIIVGTPGKLNDAVKRRLISLESIKVFVLDEADLLLNQDHNMGKDVTALRQKLPKTVQNLFFSATYPEMVRDFVKRFAPSIVTISVKNEDLGLNTILPFYQACCNFEEKFQVLQQIYSSMTVGQSLIFLNSRQKAFRVAECMRKEGFGVSLICGTQRTGPEMIDAAQRDAVMEEFRSGVTKVLVATDVLSRGIDVPAVTLVVNFELPISFDAPRGSNEHSGETYLHRICRTGRFGKKGCVVDLVDGQEQPRLMEITKLYGLQTTNLNSDFERLERLVKRAR